MKVVQVCGFEALPPDLAVLLAAETARERWGEELAEADVSRSRHGPAGPAAALGHDLRRDAARASPRRRAARTRAAVADPAALITDPALAGGGAPAQPDHGRAAPRPRGAVIAPMAPAAFINPAVIQRTAALVAAERGGAAEPFRYREGVALDGSAATLPLRYAARGRAVRHAGGGAGAARAPGRRCAHRVGEALRKVLPSSGFGPAGDRLEAWKWRMSVEARTTGGQAVRVDVDADGHPGYLATARMLGEAGPAARRAGRDPRSAPAA